MEGENIYDKIQEIFGESPGTLSILEEKVDIDLQMEYFESLDYDTIEESRENGGSDWLKECEVLTKKEKMIT